MKIKLIISGKPGDELYKTGIADYEARIKRYIPFETIRIPGIKNPGKLSIPEVKRIDSAKIISLFTSSDIVVLLDEKGKEMTSSGLAKFLNQRFHSSSSKSLLFAIGGAYGFDELIRSKADFILSLSQMTFPHQMIRLLFLEQLYRAFTIINHESYHHD
jgi:23S rRNA (pseudouridine1915-N3)-methyltransferase